LRILYRARQFWHALNTSPTSEDLALARSVLTPAQMSAFSRLQPSEQHHAIAVLRKLEAQDETHPDLMVAALLHDLGKCLVPLKPYERALIVLVEAIAADKVRQRAADSEKPHAQRQRGWRRAFNVAQGHPEWGAQIALEAGASPLVVALIRRHQEHSPEPPQSLEDGLLRKLQLADDDS
jgi:hypothetical protein